MIAAGSIPRPSEFWPNSAHRAATAARGNTDAIDPTFAATTRHLDLTESVGQLDVPVLLQFGRNDDWIDPNQVAALPSARFLDIEWYDDDHAMTAPETFQQRLQFIHAITLER